MDLAKFKTADDILKKYVSDVMKIELGRTIKKAYQITQQIKRDRDLFESFLFKNIETYLNSIVVELQIEKAINEGRIGNLKCEIVPNIRKSHYHLEIRTIDGKCIFTVSQVRDKNQIPRRNIFRMNYSYSNQLTIDDILGYERKQDEVYLIITHGYFKEGLNFINIGIPSPNLNDWFAKISLFEDQKIMMEIEKPEYIIEEINDDLILEVKQEIIKRVSGDDKK